MKTRLIRLYLNNFKGIEDAYVVEFGSGLTLLYGPNGYGKTTIFDSIELALTGTIKRIQEENNEHGSKTHDSTVLHNRKGKPVIVKLEVETHDGRRVVITRVIPALSQRVSTSSFWDKIITYQSNEFDSETEEDKLVTQEELEVSIFGEKGGDFLAKFYRLLNYVSQSEATFFLKLKQGERYTQLSPLMDLSENTSELASIKNYRRNVAKLKTYIEGRIAEYKDIYSGQSPDTQTIAYKRITVGEIIPKYDLEHPYQDLPITQAYEARQTINRDIEELKQFFQHFNPKAFNQDVFNEKVRSHYRMNDYVDHLIFRDLLSDESLIRKISNTHSLIYQTRTRDSLLKYVYKNHLSEDQFGAYRSLRTQFKKYGSLLADEQGARRNVQSMLRILSNVTNRFNEDVQKQAAQYLDEYNTIATSINSGQKLTKELQEFRNHLIKHTETSNHQSCPLCGHDWKSVEGLWAAIDEKTKAIDKLAGAELKMLDSLEKRIQQKFLDDLVERATGYMHDNEVKVAFFNTIEPIGALNTQDRQLHELLNEIIPSAKEFVVDRDILETDVDDRVIALREAIDQGTDVMDRDIFDRLQVIKGQEYSKFENEVAEQGFKAMGVEVSKEDLAKIKLGTLNSLRESLKKHAQEFLEKNVVDRNSLTGQELYKKFFDTNMQKFEQAKNSIVNKEKYLELEYNNSALKSLNAYKTKLAKLSKIYESSDQLANRYDDALKKYQFKLTKPLKIPFYIYSAKILQNTPSGQGIFIKVDPSSSSIILSTNHFTTHDALHQLSSGQLAVVSMAFLLAMNVVYDRNSARLLIIDDPVQDMDALNINAFSELVRREFAHDYQMIVSTHDDRDMQYMKFTIGKEIEQSSITAHSVQELFYQSQD